MERETELPTQTASTSSSSLPPRAPDLLRQAQAVFKRHRPLSRGNASLSGVGARRLMGAAPEAKDEAAAPRLELGWEGSASARPVTGAAAEEGLRLGRAPINQTRMGANSGTEFKSKELVSSENGLVQFEEREQSPSSEKVEISCCRALPQKNEYILDSEVYTGGINNQDEFRGRNSQQEEMADVTTLLAKKDLFSTGGSSCSTATCLSSISAPMLSSFHTRSSSETREEFNLYSRPKAKTEGNSVVTFQSRISSQMPESTRVSASAPEASVITHEVNPSQSQNLMKKEIGNYEAVHLDDKCFKGQQALGSDLQSQVLASKSLTSNTVVDTSKPSKPEKDARKKNHNPDVFFKVNGKRYQKLGKIGSGGSSEVHKVISSDCTIYALKKINLKGRDYSTAYGFCQEIEYLKKLKGKSHIIELIDYEVTDKTLLEAVIGGSMAANDGKFRADGYIYMVLEYGEIDLAHMLLQKWRDMNSSNSNLDENWLRFYWQQILLAVNTIHEERIVHSDLKPANFLLVRGSLKLIDFGIAKAIMSDTTNIQRDAQVGTLNYMSPEAFMWNEQDASGNTIKCGRPSDIWSLGCILYQMVYGRTPFSEYKTFWAKFKAITDRDYRIKYEAVSNPCLIDLMKRCLAWDRDARWRIPQLLMHPFLNPPVPPHLELSRSYHVKLLMEIADAYSNNREVYGLCSKLQTIIANLEEG